MAESPKEENPIIVLKFGGSVLTDEDRLGLAVHEIYRWRRDGWRVVAVVSALQGETEALITKGDGLGADTCGHAKATLIGLGEAKSAAILGLLLDRSGIPARVLSPAAIGLICGGEALNATPERVDTRCVRSGLEEDGVVVIPGFIGIDNHGRQVTLGRGGSDSTAVFLAAQLEAERCRLIKDVDGLYNADPAQSHGSRPDRYEIARYEDALATDGSIIQHESVELARALGVRIELCSLNSSTPSVIGVDSHRFSTPRARPAPLRVAVCGLGTVGAGVVRQLALWKDDFVLVGGACRTPQKQTGLLEDLGSITTDPVSLAREHVDIVVELIGGVELAYEIVTTALSNGKHVITANKALIAERGRSLRALAEANGVELLFSASVGGSLPVLERLRQLDPVNISGVLNGTSQFVLNAIARGVAFTDAIEHAKRLGFAEADPSRDLDGRDAMDKLRVIALQLGWEGVEIEQPGCDPQTGCRDDGVIRQVGRLSPIRASVHLASYIEHDPFFGLGDAENLVVIESANSEPVTLRGRGAGRWPTGVSVMGDLLELRRLHEADCTRETLIEREFEHDYAH